MFEKNILVETQFIKSLDIKAHNLCGCFILVKLFIGFYCYTYSPLKLIICKVSV